MSVTEDIPPVEEIPNSDMVCRLIEVPKTFDREANRILKTIFEFPNGDGESVVWRKYAQTNDKVHYFGCMWEQVKRQRQEERQGRESSMRYVGFAENKVGVVRDYRTKRGHGFSVEHAPIEGIQHAEVRYSPAGSQSFEKKDRAELRLAIAKMFAVLIPYSPSS